MGYHTEEYETIDKVQNIVILNMAGAVLNVQYQSSLKVIVIGLFYKDLCVLRLQIHGQFFHFLLDWQA